MTSSRGEDVLVRIGELRAVVGPPRKKRFKHDPQGMQPPTWLVLAPRPLDGGISATVAYGSFTVDDQGELESVKITNGPVPADILGALLEAGRHQWRRR
jgi:hypothetical protein